MNVDGLQKIHKNNVTAFGVCNSVLNLHQLKPRSTLLHFIKLIYSWGYNKLKKNPVFIMCILGTKTQLFKSCSLLSPMNHLAAFIQHAKSARLTYCRVLALPLCMIVSQRKYEMHQSQLFSFAFQLACGWRLCNF